MPPVRERALSASGSIDDEDGRKVKRKRAAFSCTECTKGKAKCDRQQPCGRCTARRIPRLCHYLVDGYEDPLEMSKDIRDRLTRIENLLLQSPPASHSNRSERSYHLISTDRRLSDTHADSPGPSTQRGGFVTRGRYYGPSAMSHVGDGSAMDIMKALDVPDPETPDQDQNGSDRRPPRALMEIVHEMPPKSLCDELVRLYFDNINLTRYPIPQDIFNATYEALWDGIRTLTLEPWIIHRLPLIFIILAISALSAPSSTFHLTGQISSAAESEKKLAKANEMYAASRRASAYSDTQVQGRGDILMVMSDLLTVRFLILVRRAPDSLPFLGGAICRAQALGLHRHHRVVGADLTDEEVQERRLVWSFVYHMDRYCSLLLGKPLGISDRSCDVDAPRNLSTDGSELGSADLTMSSFFIVRHSLSSIMGRISDEAYGREEPPYAVIRDIESALQAWARRLPTDLQLRSYGYKNANVLTDPILAIHQHFASTEYNFARISLHRPFLARADPSGQYVVSREACLEAAMDDLWARTVFNPPGMENLSTGSYRVTNSLVILGISLLLNPTPEKLQSIYQCLSDFVAARRGNTKLLDAIKVKEIAMVELLQMKADQGLLRASRAASPQPGQGMDTSQPPPLANFWLPDDSSRAFVPSDPDLQTFFDQLWGQDALNDLYGGVPIGVEANPGGEVMWDSFAAMLSGIDGNGAQNGGQSGNTGA